jgi:hypothetical protein
VIEVDLEAAIEAASEEEAVTAEAEVASEEVTEVASVEAEAEIAVEEAVSEEATASRVAPEEVVALALEVELEFSLNLMKDSKESTF